FNLSPRPAQLTTNDVTVPANGTRSILINMASLGGNPPNISAATFSNICVHYTRASVSQLSGVVTTVTITNGGSGYTTPPTVTFTDASGTGATATTTIGGGRI